MVKEITSQFLPFRISSSNCNIQIDVTKIDYSLLNFRNKRKAFLNFLLRMADCRLEKVEVKTEWLRSYMQKMEGRTFQCNYIPNFQVYTLSKNQEGDFELSDPEYFDGYNFNPLWDTRDILLSEAVIEIESADKNKTQGQNDLISWEGTLETIWSLQKHKIHFAVFYAEGMRTPHIHIYELFKDVQDWAEKEMAMALFCRKVIPFEYFHLADRNLWGQHTIALEFAKHYRAGHIKKLLFEYLPEVQQ